MTTAAGEAPAGIPVVTRVVMQGLSGGLGSPRRTLLIRFNSLCLR